MPFLANRKGKDEREEQTAGIMPVLDAGAILAGLFDDEQDASIEEGARIEFYEGKRQKNGQWIKTGHQYWQWVKYRIKENKRERYRPYGGRIETVPLMYAERSRQYIASRKSGTLADEFFRVAT